MEALFVGLHDINFFKNNQIQQKSDTFCAKPFFLLICLEVEIIETMQQMNIVITRRSEVNKRLKEHD